MLMIKKKKYSGYTKSELLEELHIMIDNCNGLEWQIENQAKYINQNYISIEWIEKQIKTVCDNIEAETFGKWLIKEWRKENG